MKKQTIYGKINLWENVHVNLGDGYLVQIFSNGKEEAEMNFNFVHF